MIMTAEDLKPQTLITTRVGKYIWNPILQLVDWIPVGRRRATITLHLRDRENTELGSMIVATNHMSKMLKERKKGGKSDEMASENSQRNEH